MPVRKLKCKRGIVSMELMIVLVILGLISGASVYYINEMREDVKISSFVEKSNTLAIKSRELIDTMSIKDIIKNGKKEQFAEQLKRNAGIANLWDGDVDVTFVEAMDEIPAQPEVLAKPAECILHKTIPAVPEQPSVCIETKIIPGTPELGGECLQTQRHYITYYYSPEHGIRKVHQGFIQEYELNYYMEKCQEDAKNLAIYYPRDYPPNLKCISDSYTFCSKRAPNIPAVPERTECLAYSEYVPAVPERQECTAYSEPIEYAPAIPATPAVPYGIKMTLSKLPKDPCNKLQLSLTGSDVWRGDSKNQCESGNENSLSFELANVN